MLFRSNSNIQPAEEYELRKRALLEYAERRGVTVVELEYDPERWQQATRSARTRAQRCQACYRLRLESVATWAAANGVDAIATTLTVSPYQDADAIARAGDESARSHGVGYLHEDFTDRYLDATRRSRDESMYRQNYCGCLPSKAEAQAERELRRARRETNRTGG